MRPGAYLLAVVLAGSVAANPPLREVKAIDDGLFAIGLADQIRKNCPDIQARLLRALGALQDLNNEAKALGYSKAEIDAHVDSDAEKERLRARGKAYMAELGLEQDAAGYCALGHKEIDRSSTVGVLLRRSE
nr:DUF5333 domain-containing protein [uncultured Roseobacter sp.]